MTSPDFPLTKDVQGIIKDIKGAYGINGWFTNSGVRGGSLYRGSQTKIVTPNDVIHITGYRWFKEPLRFDVVAAYNHFNDTTYIYCPVTKKMTKIKKKKITYHGSCPARVPNFQTFLMSIYVKKI